MIKKFLLNLACKILRHYNLGIDVYIGNTFIFNNHTFKIVDFTYNEEQGCLPEINIHCYDYLNNELFKANYMQDPFIIKEDK